MSTNNSILAKHKQDLSALTKEVGLFPTVKYYIEQLNIHNILNAAIPYAPQNDLPPAQVLCIMVINIVMCKHPLYKIANWMSEYCDGRSAVCSEEASLYNDDRCARALDKLYLSDRNTLLTQISAKAIEVHKLELKQIHNDSTSISFAGAYANSKCSKSNEDSSNNADDIHRLVHLTYGFSKEHRPDCKQVVFGLSITADGNVPVQYELFDGNRTDDTTHVDTWSNLRKVIGDTDFTYIADSKLCTMSNLSHIANSGGTFITVLPKNRKEVTEFHTQIRSGWQIPWQEEYKVPSTRKKNEFTTYKLYEDTGTTENYRIIWIHSNVKAKQDLERRNRRITKTIEQLEELVPRLNKRKLKTADAIQQTLKTINNHDFVSVTMTENTSITKKQVGRGKPTANTKYKDIETKSFAITWQTDQEAIIQDSLTDGIFPLISNTTEAKTDILKKYKTQPFLEKRFQTAKSVLEIAPVFLKKPERIEAIMFLYFIALMIVSLIERNIRKELKQNPQELRILPEKRNTKSPTWNNLEEFFIGVCLSIIYYKTESILEVRGISRLHENILSLLGVPVDIYYKLDNDWWKFELTG